MVSDFKDIIRSVFKHRRALQDHPEASFLADIDFLQLSKRASTAFIKKLAAFAFTLLKVDFCPCLDILARPHADLFLLLRCWVDRLKKTAQRSQQQQMFRHCYY